MKAMEVEKEHASLKRQIAALTDVESTPKTRNSVKPPAHQTNPTADRQQEAKRNTRSKKAENDSPNREEPSNWRALSELSELQSDADAQNQTNRTAGRQKVGAKRNTRFQKAKNDSPTREKPSNWRALSELRELQSDADAHSSAASAARKARPGVIQSGGKSDSNKESSLRRREHCDQRMNCKAGTLGWILTIWRNLLYLQSCTFRA